MSGRLSGTPPRRVFLGVILLLAAAASLVKARSYDLWWHLETGEQILRTFSIPRADDFSFTSGGTAWVDHEWLFQIILYALYAAMGPFGLALLKAACALVLAAAAYATMRRCDTPPGAALIVIAVSTFGLRFRLAERPETISLPLAAVVGAILIQLASRPERPARRLGLLAALTVLWANLHAGALLAPVLAAACALGALLQIRRASSGDRQAAVASALTVSAAAGLTSVCLLLNPRGYKIFLVPLGIWEALEPGNLINPEWLSPSWSAFPLFYAAAVASGAATLAQIGRRRPLALCRAALLLLATGMAFSSVRHIGLFFALMPLTIDLGAMPQLLEKMSRLASVPACLGAAAWMALVPPPGATPGIGIQPGRFPEKAADFIDAHLTQARLYNDVAFGGYLIWRGFPLRRVFIDGRNEVHASLLRDLAASVDDGRKWRHLLDRFGVEGALVSYRTDRITVRDAITGIMSESTFSELHFPRSDWALIYWDDVAMLFVRRPGRYSGLAAELEYLAVRPEAWMQGDVKDGKVEPQSPLAREIRRKLAQEPGSRLANAMARVYGVDATFPAR